MKQYWIAVGTVLFVFLGAFLVIEQLNVPLLHDPSELMTAKSMGAAGIGIALLVADVFLPVPSSLIMISNGVLFGVVGGTILSLLGSLGATLTGFFLGRTGESLLARFVSPKQRQRADQLLQKWGILAIIVTRPLPLLAETTAIMAGTSTMTWPKVTYGAIAGSLPAAMLYALTGATAASFNQSGLTFGLVLLIAGSFWLLGRRTHAR